MPPPTQRPGTPAPRIVVTISRQGEISIGAERISDVALPVKLRELASRNKGAELVIAADKDTPQARATFVIDHAKRAGLTQVSLSIQPQQQPPTLPMGAQH